MTAGPWLFTTAGRADFINGVFNLETDTFKIALLLSTSNLSDASTTYAGLTNEHAQEFGYTTGGEAIGPIIFAGSTIRLADGTAMPSWTASGGDLTARWAAIYETGGGKILCYCLLDATPADVTATDGTDLDPPELWLLSLAPYAVPGEERRSRKGKRKKAHIDAVLEEIETTVRSIRKPVTVKEESPSLPVVPPVPVEDLAVTRAREETLRNLLLEAERSDLKVKRLATLKREAEQAMAAHRAALEAAQAERDAWERILAEEEELLLLS